MEVKERGRAEMKWSRLKGNLAGFDMYLWVFG